ncbi:hypothetical protein [Siminovitchia fordii]|nr:hypothetical protein [Siminovitchia fordii]
MKRKITIIEGEHSQKVKKAAQKRLIEIARKYVKKGKNPLKTTS